MLLKIQLLCCLALLVTADNSIDLSSPSEALVEQSVPFETSHKRQQEDGFQTAHKIPLHSLVSDSELDLQDFKTLHNSMSLYPTKERPELNPILSALINEDVMKSIEAKRAIEEEELEMIKAELEAASRREEELAQLEQAQASNDALTEASIAVLTTASPPVKSIDLDDDINVGFVDQSINLEAAGSENNKKSRIEIKKGPNGQDYEYEYVYYYEDEDDENKSKTVEAPAKSEHNERGKSRYSNIERSTTATPTGNSLVSNKAKGRSSSISDNNADADSHVEAERLPANTRFPSRGKNIEAQPTPALDSLENAAEKKKISVKRPSLELVDSETFNTDEKQVKGIRNSDTEAKPAIAIEQEQAAAAKSAEKKEKKDGEVKSGRQPTIGSDEENATEKNLSDEDVEQTTLSMEKAALDLYAILANENFNMDMTTDSDMDATTMVADTTDSDDDIMTTLVQEEPSSTTTTTTTTTTTEPTTTTTTTTTTTAAPSLFGGKRAGLGGPGRNRFKLKQGGGAAATSTTTTEAPPASETAPKTGKNRFSRPPIGGRNRASARTTTAAPAPAEEEEVAAKEVKPVSSSFGRGRPRNRFNLRSTTTTEKPAEEAEGQANQEAVSSTTARSVRGGRPALNLRGRSRTTTAKPTVEKEAEAEGEAAPEEKSAPTPSAAVKPSRFNRPGGRLPPRGKLTRTTEAPASEDSAADSSHHNDVKGEGEGEEHAEKSETETKPAAAHGLNRLKTRPRLDNLHKTENAKPKAAAPSTAPVAVRKVNPLLAKRRLQLGHSTTEAPAEEDSSTAAEESEGGKEEPTVAAATSDDANSAKEEETDATETTTKQQARGLGLLGQRKRLPLRKPGTIL